MDEIQAQLLQRSIEAKRRDLTESIDRLRFQVRRRADPREQLRAHPRAVLGFVFVASLCCLAVGFFGRFRRAH